MIGRRGFGIGLIALAQVFLLTFASLAAAERWVSMPLDDDDMYVLLVMGSDQGPPRAESVLDGRADAIQVVVVDAERESVSIVSIPRDTYVPVRGMGTTKINAMLTQGAENAVGTIEDLAGLEVDDWIVTGFDALITGVDAFGGFHMDVEQRFNDSQAQTNLDPGHQHLTGWRALGYARDRNSRSDGDIGRAGGQARLLRAMHVELQDKATSPAQLVDFAGILRRHTVTSIGADRLIRLGAIALQIDPENVAQVTLPGRVGSAGAASVYRLSDGAFAVFQDLREDGRLAELDAPAEGD